MPSAFNPEEIRKALEEIRKALAEKLRLVSPSFIPEMAELKPESSLLESGGLGHVYNARISRYDSAGNYLYTLHDVDLSQYWTEDSLNVPEGWDLLSIYSRRGLRYPYVCAYLKLPDWVGMGYDDYCQFWIGFELGGGLRWGDAAWLYQKRLGTNAISPYGGGCGVYTSILQTVSLPSDYLTAKHGYWVKVNRNQIWYGIDSRIRAFVLPLKGGVRQTVSANSNPYSIMMLDMYIPETQHTLIELGGLRKGGKFVGATVGLGYGDYRWAEGDPQPPLSMPMYVQNSDTVLAGYSISSGSVSSHPIPVYGYAGKMLYFMAGQAGSLLIEVLTQRGNWRTYDTDTVSANTLWWYKMTGDAVLARLTFTPLTYPCTISEAEVVLNG
jgi:hypothetical protein